MNLIDQIQISEMIKNYAQVLAVVAGALYLHFWRRVVMGDREIDIDVSVKTTRQASKDVEYLSVEVEIKKGSRGSFSLHDAIIRTEQDGVPQEEKLEIGHFGHIQKGMQNTIDTSKWKRNDSINLSAGETMQIGRLLKVRKDSPCLVEVHVLGTPVGSLAYKWRRASTVSLPNGSAVSGE
jgi:hypothetical protein